jgi:hypothetical protein
MTVGTLRWEDTPTGRTLTDLHVDNDEEPAEVAARAIRSPSDYAEYHCLLVRTAAARDGAPFDPAICCVHEHIDLSLTMKERGLATWFEPAARVTYLAVEPWALGDLGYRRRRWDRAAGESSIRAFARKWGVADDDRSFGSVRSFLHAHQARLDPLEPRCIGSPDLAVPMLPAELPQTRSSLLDLAIARGYSPEAVLVIARQCDNVTLMMNGGYRPCGRPFVAHLIGTAGVLVRYGFRIEVVLAGLMHAVYSHCPAVSPGPKPAIDAVCDALGGPGAPVERRVRAYTRRAESLRSLAASRAPVDDASLEEAEIVAIVAANEVDMALSGEHRYATRDDRLGADEIALARRVCAALGVEGLGDTLVAAAAAPAAPPALRTRFPVSYRIDGMTLKPMASQAFFAFDRSRQEKERTKATG